MSEHLCRFVARPAVIFLLALLAGPLAAQQAESAPDFPLAVSLVGMPEKIVVGEPFAFELKVTNRGAADASSRITFRVPTALMHAARPDCPWTYLPEDRGWEKVAVFSPGESSSCGMEFLAPDNHGAVYLAVEMTVSPSDLSEQIYHRADLEVPLEDKPAQGKILFRVGRVGFRWLELGILFFFASFFGLLFLGRRRSRYRGPESGRGSGYGAAALGLLCLFFLVFFGFMARDDWRTMQEFRQASCEVLDTEIVVNENKSSTRPRKTYASYDARLVVGYETDGQKRVALAGRPDSHLDLSAEKVSELMAGYESGQPVQCWVDPQDASKVLVDRGPGGAYFFALIPLGILGLMFFFWRRK